jgi:hypothetical protein
MTLACAPLQLCSMQYCRPEIVEPGPRFFVYDSKCSGTRARWPLAGVLNSPCDYPTCVCTAFCLPALQSVAHSALSLFHSLHSTVQSTCHCNQDCKSATYLSCASDGSVIPRAQSGPRSNWDPRPVPDIRSVCLPSRP